MKTRAIAVITDHVDEYLTVERGSEEWDSMWINLSRLPCNEELEPLEEALTYGDNEDGYGEAWQYMCSFHAPRNTLKNRTTKGVWDMVYVHEFRHRCHPILEQRVCVHIQASDAFAQAMDDKYYGVDRKAIEEKVRKEMEEDDNERV